MAYNRTTKTAARSARRISLVKATSAMALATGLAIGGSGTAHAQAFEGNPTVVSGGVNIVRSPGTDDIQVDTDQAVINWTTNDTALTGGPINFLPSGRTAFFRNNPSAQNFFTVLNRIIPTGTSRAIQFNGTIISQLQTALGVVPGGNVWFYSPGGIVVNSTAVIDVGGLLLTSSDPVRDGAGNFITPGGSFTLGPSASASSVIVQPGAQILATPENSYVAMVAPTVLQGGNVNVNGSALYVGAEAATITFGGNGLFDIQVTTGTNGTGGIAVGHGGVTTGPASGGTGDNHRIYMVAVPKNNAITLALSGGSLGFDVAGAADVVGNSIILSAGYDVFGDFVDSSAPVNPGQQANISISAATVTSAINAEASFNTNVGVGSGTLNLASDARFYGNNQSTVTAFGTGTILVGGDLTVSSDRFGQSEGENVVGGNAQLYAQAGGSIFVNGSAFVSANGFGGGSSTTAAVGSGTGGIADVRSFGNSVLEIGGDLFVNANGFAGDSDGLSGSNAGIGGTVIIVSGRNATVDNNSTMLVNGNLFATANGFGSSNFGAGVAGLGRGGSIQIESGSGTGIASSNNVLTINGSILSSADGFGGIAFNDGIGGAGFGGQSSLNAGVGGRVNVGGPVTLTSFGFGGNADTGVGSGGAGTGGSSFAQIFGSGGVLSLGSDLVLQATGVGGLSGFGATSQGGLGTGGQAQIALAAFQTGGAITVQGQTQLDALGLGGQGTIGGDGRGGTQANGGGAYITANGAGDITLNGGVLMSSGGIGGAAAQAGIGGSGNGIGGSTQIVAAGAGTNINITGLVDLNANGAVFSSFLTGTDGGNGTGGNASISQNNGGAITITGDAVVRATGTGDANFGGGDGIAGNGVGGDARIAVNDRFITITGNADVDASGRGGDSLGGIRGGNGIGGLANLGAGAGTLSIGGAGLAKADGTGGSSPGSGSGGDGLGGRAVIGSIPGGIIQITSAATASAQGFGGNAAGSGATGGLGDGGEAQLFADNTGSVTVGGFTTLNASAFGGSAVGGANSGAAQGGLVTLLSFGTGQITLNQDAILSAQALGGNVNDGSGNAAGATGGTINLIASGAGGGITVNANLFVDAIAGAGSAITGTIGDALGGNLELQAASGLFTVTGSVSLDATAFGGNSTLTGNGGNATGGRTAVVIGGLGGGTINIGGALDMTSDGVGGSAQTGNGGTGTGGLSEAGTISRIGAFNFGGLIAMTANGFGGDALLAGNGGSGVGGESRFGANDTPMTGGDLFITASGRGGSGALGGSGGDAVGGVAFLNAGFGNVIGLLDFGNVFLFADAIGGAGGTGATDTTGGAGGAGGNAIGGQAFAVGTARNGQLDIDNLQITVSGFGGAGGAGGAGTAGVGGVGGAGGSGTGGFAQIGTLSSTIVSGVNPTPTGFMRMADAFLDASGVGGTGGDGGSGTTGNGNGGIGGLGTGGDLFVAARGSVVQSSAMTLLASGFGGNGGNGAVLGNGGNGIGGTVGVESTEQFMAPTNRGTLIVGDLLAIAQGNGGSGATNGLSFYETGSFFRAVNGDVTANSIVFNIAGDAAEPTDIVEDYVRISDATVNAGNSFTFVTPNALSVLVNNASLNAGGVGLSAGTFVADTVITAPTAIGSINADSIGLFSNGDVRITADLNAVQDIAISVPGSVDLLNIFSGGVISISGDALNLGDLSSGNHINLFGGSIGTGAISAANFVEIFASGGISTSDIIAGGYILAFTDSGDITLGNLDSGQFIALETGGGNIGVGNVASLEETEFDAIGSVSFGDVTTGLNFEVLADGNITGGNITAQSALAEADYGVGLAATGNIQVGSIQSTRNIGALSTGAFTSGGLSTSESVILLVDGNIAINGGLTTGANRFFYVGNSSMSALLDDGGNQDTSFIGGAPDPVFAVAPVRTLGSLTVTGPISTGNLFAGLGTAFNASQSINVGQFISIDAASVVAGSMTSGAGSFIRSGSMINVGDLQSGGRIVMLGVTDVQTGSVNAIGDVTIVSQDGALVTGSVTGTRDILLLAERNITTGAITGGTQAGDFIRIFGSSLFPVTTPLISFDPQTFVNTVDITRNFGVTTINGTLTGGDTGIFARDGAVIAGAANLTNGGLFIDSGTITMNSVNATDDIFLFADAGNIITGNLLTNGFVLMGADVGSIQTGNIGADVDVEIRAAQSVTTGDIVASGIFTNFVTSIAIDTVNGSIVTGNLTGSGPIGLVARGSGSSSGNLTTGNITTTSDMLLLASGNVSTGALAGNATSTGTIFIGNSSALPGSTQLATFDFDTLLATTPVAVGGSVSIGGPVTTGSLLSASSGGFSASSAITAATRITIDTQGSAVFGGLAAAPTISVTSRDIAFSQNGGLGDANTGTLTLTNSGDGLMLIGGSASGEGYTLDAGEMARLRAGNIVVRSPFSGSSGIGIEIRDFTLNGSGGSSGTNLNGAEGSISFQTAGTIRVNGNAIFNAMGSTNRVSLNAGRVEVNADSGGIFLNGSSPGGVLSITANNIHIASASLLGQLAQNPTFTGRDAALALPIATARPDGVIQASRLVFNVGNTLLIQNTGTSLLGAGFFGRVGGVEINPLESQSSQAGIIDMVIHGQLLDTGDIVRNGSSVRDLLFPVSSSDGGTPGTITGFTANSSVNGCVLNAASCGGGGISETGPTVVTHAGPPPPQTSEERQAEREQEEAEAAAEEAGRGEAAPRRPIMPPVTIVNTRRLGVEPVIAEPVTSGGNPNLQLDQPLPTPLPDTGGQP